jgi:prephenate dehydrogenase
LVRGVAKFWRDLGMTVVQMSPSAHDQAVARVSHLEHAVSALLMLLPKDADLPLASTGLRDMTRLAGGDPEVWRDIFLTNRSAILSAIDDLDETLMIFRDLVSLGDSLGIERFLAEARSRRQNGLSHLWSNE